MHPERRAQLTAWARDTGALIVEDDYDAEYRFGSRPIAPLRSRAGDCVAYVGTTSKVLAPDLRLGWLLVPAHMAAAVSAEHSVAHALPSVINQAAFATLLESGDFDRHLRRTRAIYRARRAAVLASVISRVPLRITGGAAGLHLMAWLPPQASECDVVAKANLVGVAVDGLRGACAVKRDLRPALVVGYGAISEAAIPAAISALIDVVSNASPTTPRLVAGER
jgi:GntR family transcriptional regulator/MocR family aminotransferase